MPTQLLKVRETHTTATTKPSGGSLAASLDDGAEVHAVGAAPWNTVGEMLVYDTKHGMGRLAGAKWHHAFRFELPSTGWLSGKIIDNVTLKLTHTGVGSGSYTATAYMQKSTTPAAVADVGSNISNTTNRPRTTANCAFGSAELGSHSANVKVGYTGSTAGANEFAEMLKEVMTLGTSSIDAIMLLIIHSGSGTGLRQVYSSYFSAHRPELEILYRENVVDLDFKKREIVRLDTARVRI